MRKLKNVKAVVTAAAMMLTLAACGGGAESSDEAGAGASDKAEEVNSIVVGSGFNYYPFDFMDGEEMVGFEVDVWNEIGERSGLEVEFMRADFAGLFGLLDKGDVDTIANQVAVTPEREEKYNFSIPYCYNAVKMIVPKGNPQNVQTTDDMIGKTVITGTGDNGFEWL